MALQFNRRFHISVDDADITTNNQNNVSKSINETHFQLDFQWFFIFSTFLKFELFSKTFICMEKL